MANVIKHAFGVTLCLMTLFGTIGCNNDEKRGSSETAEPTNLATDPQPVVVTPEANPVATAEGLTPAIETPKLPDDPVAVTLQAKGIVEETHFRTLKQPFDENASVVTVTEFFWYGCTHCMNAEPMVNAWKTRLPGDSKIVKLPAIWNALMELHARVFFIVELEANENDKEKIHAGLFEKIIALREDRVGLIDQTSSLRQWLSNWGITEARFDELVNSGNVQNRIDASKAIQRKANISGTPAFIVGGKYYLNARAVSEDLSLIELGNAVVEAVQSHR